MAHATSYSTRFLLIALTALGAPMLGISSAFALTQEAAIESCRESVGKPRVQACVRNLVQTRGGPGMQYVEQCRAPVKPLVQACVRAAMMKAHGRADVAIALPAAKKEEFAPDLAIKGGFVAPPRTIADITAILDNEKPDPDKVAERKARAEREPPKSLSKKELAEFYLDRGYARIDLGLTATAIEDGKLAIELGKDSHEPLFVLRARQMVALQQIGSGDVKKRFGLPRSADQSRRCARHQRHAV